MRTVEHMLETSRSQPLDLTTHLACVEKCFECMQACTACADACLGEPQVGELVRCIRLNLDCADVCLATGQIVLRQTATDCTLVRAIVESCTAACKQCGDECIRYGEHGMEHCQICAEACQRCQDACIDLLRVLAA